MSSEHLSKTTKTTEPEVTLGHEIWRTSAIILGVEIFKALNSLPLSEMNQDDAERIFALLVVIPTWAAVGTAKRWLVDDAKLISSVIPSQLPNRSE